jgi:hypothetical protein
LGGYLVLLALTGRLTQSLANVLPVRGRPQIPASLVALDILQFVVAIAVVVLALALARGPLAGRVIGSLVVAGGAILHAVFLTMRAYGGDFDVPREIVIPFNAVFVNSWFAVLLLVGVGWLLARGARRGWLALAATLLVVPWPMAFALGGVDFGATALVMYALCAVVGAVVIAAGRPLQD